MNAIVQAQRSRQNAAVGLGAAAVIAAGAGALSVPTPPPPPTSPYWHAVQNPAMFQMLAMSIPAYRAAFNASQERMVMGTQRNILWRTWNVSGVWYATSRANSAGAPQLFQLQPPAPPRVGRGAAGTPAGTGDSPHARLAMIVDDDGVLDVSSFGYDQGVGSLATQNPDLRRWAALPVTPDPGSPNWRKLTGPELAILNTMVGWQSTVATAQAQGQGMFKFRASWYRPSSGGFDVLSGGSGRGGARGLHGVPEKPRRHDRGLGVTNPSFIAPSADQVAANQPGANLAALTQALLAYFNSSGVPSEHVNDPNVMAWQEGWNADPISQVNGANSALSEDGGYGPNSALALASINGGNAPGINTTGAPVVPTTPVVVTPTVVVPGSASGGSSYTVPLIVGGVVLGAAVLTAAVMHHKKSPHRKYRIVAPSHAV